MPLSAEVPLIAWMHTSEISSFPEIARDCPGLPVACSQISICASVLSPSIFAKIVCFHIQLRHVPDNKLYLLAAAMTLAQLVKILLARDS